MRLSLLALLAALAFVVEWFRARAIAAQGMPLNSRPRDHGMLVALESATTALLVYVALMPLLPAIRTWIAICLSVAATIWLVFLIGPEFRARKLFDWLVGWLLMAASAAIVMIAVGIGLAAVSKNL